MANKLFYLNGQPLDVEISPVLAQTLDETIDNLTITLKLDESYGDAPLDPLKNEVALVHVDDNNVATTINKFVISADNVQLATENPLRFKHTLTLVQRAQKFTKKEMRNTVFSENVHINNFIIGKSYYLDSFISPNESTIYFDYIFRPTLTDAIDGNGHINATTYKTVSNDGSKVIIDISKIDVHKIGFIKNVEALIITSDSYKGGQYEEPIKINTKNIYPQNLDDLFINQQEQYRPTPMLLIEINDGINIIDSKTIELSKSNFNSNNVEYIDETTIQWLEQYNSYNAIFSVYFVDLNASPSTWNTPALKDNKIPFLLTLSLEIVIKQVQEKCYEVIETLLKQQLKETADYNRTTDPDHYVPLFKLPYWNENDPSDPLNHNENLYKLLTTTNAPNFVFTQGNMYEVLVEIFKLFDAIFTIDSDGYLDIEYYNEQSQHKIEFEEGKKAGRQSSLGEERYGNRLISYYQNTKINDRFPNSNQVNSTAYLRSKTIGVPGQSDFAFIVQKPIDIITKAKIIAPLTITVEMTIYYNFRYEMSLYMWDTADLSFNIPQFNRVIDITPYVNEKTIWTVLNESTSFPINNDYRNVGKFNSFVYEKGTKYILVSEYFNNELDIRQSVLENVIKSSQYCYYGLNNQYNPQTSQIGIVVGHNDWTNVKLAVEYIALCDGKVVNESIDYKYDGGMIINQNNGSIDINKLGLNMVGLSLKLGQPTLTMTQKICTWEKAVKKGDYFIKDGARWVANTCNYTLINKDLIEASIEFVKNFNGLASRIELNREKRLSNISNELTVKCEENYGEFIYYSNKPPMKGSAEFYGEKVVFEEGALVNMIEMGFGVTAPSFVVDSSFDASNYIVNGSISTFNPSQYNQRQLVKLTGYLATDVTDANNKYGSIILYENYDPDTEQFSGSLISIPYASTAKISMELNDLTDQFDIMYDYYDSHSQPAVLPFRRMGIGDEIEVLVVCDGTQILGGVVTKDNDIFGLSGWFDPTDMVTYYPGNTYTVEYASLTAYDENDNVIQEDEYSASDIAIPMVVYGSGNSVCFEMSFDSPIAAGTQLVYPYTSVYASGGWFSKYVLYAAKDGTATKFTIDFIMLQEELTRQFPKLAHDNGQGIATTPLATYSFGKINKLAYYKKPNEIFALNYQLHFLPFGDLNDCFLSNEYIKNNGFSNGLNKKTLHIIYTTTEDNDDFEYSIMDTKGYGSHTAEITSHGTYTQQNTHRFYIDFDTELTTQEKNKIKTWAIVDEDNNLYFSCNHAPSSGNFYIWFVFMHHRKEEV